MGDESEEGGEDPQRKVPKLKLQFSTEGKVKGHRSRQSSSSALESQRCVSLSVCLCVSVSCSYIKRVPHSSL